MMNQRKSVNITIIRTVLGFFKKISSKLRCFAWKKGVYFHCACLPRGPVLPTTVVNFSFNLLPYFVHRRAKLVRTKKYFDFTSGKANLVQIMSFGCFKIFKKFFFVWFTTPHFDFIFLYRISYADFKIT